MYIKIYYSQGLKNIPLANTAAGLMVSNVNSQNSLSSVTRSQSWKMLRCKSEIYNNNNKKINIISTYLFYLL